MSASTRTGLDSRMFEVYGSICLARFLDHSSLVSRHLVGVCDCALSPIIVQSILHNLGGATAASWHHNSATPRLTAVTLVAHKSEANTQSSIFRGGRSFCVPCKCQNLACRVWLLGMLAVALAVVVVHAMPCHGSHSQSHSQGQAVPRMHQIKLQQSTATTARCLAPDVLATRCQTATCNRQTPIEHFSPRYGAAEDSAQALTLPLPLFWVCSIVFQITTTSRLARGREYKKIDRL